VTAWTAGHSAALLASPLVAINFHHVPRENRAQVARQLRAATGLGPTLRLDELGELDGGPATGGAAASAPGPRVFVAFYDGYRDTSLFGAELCHELGIRAFFFPLFSSVDPLRGKLTDDDLRDIATAHEVGLHTSSHLRAADITGDNVAEELLEPARRIESATGTPLRVAAWRGGLRFDETTLGDQTLRKLGIRFLVSNWSLEDIAQS
jgi:peptidoglycan/xylan/chitin deacetylase (PgdA/CDA1 family)